jgi:hypothetical protein
MAGQSFSMSVRDVGAVRRGVRGDSGRLLARRVECAVNITSSLAIIRDDVGLMNEGSGNVWEVASRPVKNGIGVAGLFLTAPGS